MRTIKATPLRAKSQARLLRARGVLRVLRQARRVRTTRPQLAAILGDVGVADHKVTWNFMRHTPTENAARNRIGDHAINGALVFGIDLLLLFLLVCGIDLLFLFLRLMRLGACAWDKCMLGVHDKGTTNGLCRAQSRSGLGDCLIGGAVGCDKALASGGLCRRGIAVLKEPFLCAHSQSQLR